MLSDLQRETYISSYLETQIHSDNATRARFQPPAGIPYGQVDNISTVNVQPKIVDYTGPIPRVSSSWSTPRYPRQGLLYNDPTSTRTYSSNVSSSCMFTAQRGYYQSFGNHPANNPWLHELNQGIAVYTLLYISITLWTELIYQLSMRLDGNCNCNCDRYCFHSMHLGTSSRLLRSSSVLFCPLLHTNRAFNVASLAILTRYATFSEVFSQVLRGKWWVVQTLLFWISQIQTAYGNINMPVYPDSRSRRPLSLLDMIMYCPLMHLLPHNCRLGQNTCYRYIWKHLQLWLLSFSRHA